MRINRDERGDTLIEVLLALAVMAVLIVTVSTLMDNGIRSSQLALERTQTQALVNGQAAALRALHETVRATSRAPGLPSTTNWERVSTVGNLAVNGSLPSTGALISDTCDPGVFGSKTPFAFPLTTATNQVAATTPNTSISQRPSSINNLTPAPGNGLWVESYRYANGSRPYIDFYIRACWDGSGSNGDQELKTVVRLYDI